MHVGAGFRFLWSLVKSKDKDIASELDKQRVFKEQNDGTGDSLFRALTTPGEKPDFGVGIGVGGVGNL